MQITIKKSSVDICFVLNSQVENKTEMNVFLVKKSSLRHARSNIQVHALSWSRHVSVIKVWEYSLAGDYGKVRDITAKLQITGECVNITGKTSKITSS